MNTAVLIAAAMFLVGWFIWSLKDKNHPDDW